jgi:hypothetical protein
MSEDEKTVTPVEPSRPEPQVPSPTTKGDTIDIKPPVDTYGSKEADTGVTRN